MNLSKKNHFSTHEAINHIPRTKTGRKVLLVCEMLESSGSLSSLMLPVFSWKLKITAYKGRSRIPTSSKLWSCFVNT